ncbi:MAG: PD-(D/E)XK nuclease family protein, partial [Candidatus Binatia bacterium]
APPPAAAGERRIELADFPAGSRPGLLVHEILERIDFRRDDPGELRRVVEGRLAAYGLEAKWREPLERTIAGLLETPLVAGDRRLRLGDVGREKRSSEMEFTLPVGPDEGSRRLTREALAEVFEHHAGGAVPAEYPQRLRELEFRPLAGFLRGYIDLVLEQDGRFWLIDWKSNHLGPRPEDYRAAGLRSAMLGHHYTLQYHLYVASLDRHLRRGVPRYRYEERFGGVLYVFLRGVTRGDGETGIFFDRPPAALVADLSAVLAAGAAELRA